MEYQCPEKLLLFTCHLQIDLYFTLLDIFPTALLRKNKHCYHQSEKISTSREEIVNKEQVSLHSCALIKWLNSTFFVCFFKNNENSTVDQKWSIID